MSERTRWRRVTGADGVVRRRCLSCGFGSLWTRRRCRRCHRCGRLWARKPKPKKRPARGTEERLRLELRHAARMADRWTSKVKTAATTLHHWVRRERHLAARLAAGPQPPRPKRERPVRRAIRLQGTAPAAEAP